MSTDAPILTETRGRVGLITLNRPQQLNALNDALMDALGQALLVFDADETIGAIVITGSAKAFAAGADIAAMADWSYMDVYRSDFITRNWETIRRVRKPVLAAVAGFAMGGGCELALACDIVIAAESAKFALPEDQAGDAARRRRHAAPAARHRQGQGDGPVPVGPRARRGRGRPPWPGVASRARRLGCSTRRWRWPRQIAGYSLPALMAIKESVNRAYESPLSEGIGFERRQLHARFASDDAHEGMRAFLEKRKPVFTHR